MIREVRPFTYGCDLSSYPDELEGIKFQVMPRSPGKLCREFDQANTVLPLECPFADTMLLHVMTGGRG